MPDAVRDGIPEARHVRIPQVAAGEVPEPLAREMRGPAAGTGRPGKPRIVGEGREILRSLNLSTACGIAAYEALRQMHVRRGGAR